MKSRLWILSVGSVRKSDKVRGYSWISGINGFELDI